MSDSFRFEGGKELEAALRALGKTATARNVGIRALKIAAEPIAEKARLLAPKDERDLEQSIKVGRAISAFQRDGNRGDYIATFVGIDESVDKRLHIYARIQEEGDAANPPQPYMRPAWDSEKHKAVDRMAPALWEEIAKANARAAKKAAKG
jgi:HK97 gp10 family phage protein